MLFEHCEIKFNHLNNLTMLHKQNLLKQFGAAVVLLSITAISCTNNDTTDSTGTTETTTSTNMMDTSATANNMMSDTSMMTTATMPAMDTMKMVKPNPAKKGMKGKVVINAPAKTTGTMEADNMGVYTNVEYIPSFPGGNKGLQTYFDKNIQYPDDASNEGVEGVVNVSFVVDENGKLTALNTVGQKLGYGLEEEALRVIGKMPTWSPGKLKGINVKTKYTLPVRFELY